MTTFSRPEIDRFADDLLHAETLRPSPLVGWGLQGPGRGAESDLECGSPALRRQAAPLTLDVAADMAEFLETGALCSASSCGTDRGREGACLLMSRDQSLSFFDPSRAPGSMQFARTLSCVLR